MQIQISLPKVVPFVIEVGKKFNQNHLIDPQREIVFISYFDNGPETKTVTCILKCKTCGIFWFYTVILKALFSILCHSNLFYSLVNVHKSTNGPLTPVKTVNCFHAVFQHRDTEEHNIYQRSQTQRLFPLIRIS